MYTCMCVCVYLYMMHHSFKLHMYISKRRMHNHVSKSIYTIHTHTGLPSLTPQPQNIQIFAIQEKIILERKQRSNNPSLSRGG